MVPRRYSYLNIFRFQVVLADAPPSREFGTTLISVLASLQFSAFPAFNTFRHDGKKGFFVSYQGSLKFLESLRAISTARL